MFKRVFKMLEAEVSGDIAYNYVAEISRHHRIQASPGLRDAAGYAVETWKAAGLDAEVVSYPADGEGLAWSSHMFKEWDCFDADREALWRLDKDHPLGRGVGTLAMYWTDGAKSLHEISELVRLERGVTDLEYLVDWYRLLEGMGLVEVHR